MFDHSTLFSPVKADLANRHGLPTDVVVGLLRYFSPDSVQYVSRVSEWQNLLCAGNGVVSETLTGLLLRAKAAFRWGDGVCLMNPLSVKAVHQTAMLFWKEEVDNTALADWDGYAQRLEVSGIPDIPYDLERKLRRHLYRVLGEAPTWSDMNGTMGSGSTADRQDFIERWDVRSLPVDIPAEFYRFNAHDTRSFYTADVCGVARAAVVPKNRKGPRFVASEPSARMFAQLAIKRVLDRIIMRAYGRRAPLWDADIHRQFLKRHANNACTIDLSDASDYISLELVDRLFPPSWRDLLFSSRSQMVRLPDGRLVCLSTCAPMGNGYCFRLLTLVCCAVLAVCCGCQPWSDYGDDMICLNRDYSKVIWALQCCGLKVNTNKTCTGVYKETCGIELFSGFDVTPFKPKRLLRVKSGWADLVAAKVAADRGLPEVANSLISGLKAKVRYCVGYQRLEYRVPCWVTRDSESEVADWPGMFRWYASKGDNYHPEVNYAVRSFPGVRWAADSDPLLEPIFTEGADIVLSEG